MAVIRIPLLMAAVIISFACQTTETARNGTPKIIPPQNAVAIAKNFAYPVGKIEFVTQAKDRDEWYNALDFGADAHLGEDWNKNTGGNTDCGEPVYAAANGIITFAQDAGPGWGNVVIITHTLANGTEVQSLYGHLQEILKTSGEVKIRDQIGKVGNANGRYPCHLHFEMRTSECPMWDQAGGGYSRDRTGWVDPSDFIDSHR